MAMSRSLFLANQQSYQGPIPGTLVQNPLTDMSWYAAFWAGDPAWSAPADGAAVSSWRNGGTLGTAATQGTGASQPLFRSSVAALGGRPAVDFVSSDYLEITSGVSLAQPFSVVWVGVIDAVGATACVGLNSTSVNYMHGVSGAGNNFLSLGTTLTATAVSANAGRLHRAYANGASSLVSVNGATVASGNAGALAVDQIILGSGRQAPATYSNYMDGKTAFLGIVAGDVSTDPMWPEFKAWVRSQYGLTIA